MYKVYVKKNIDIWKGEARIEKGDWRTMRLSFFFGWKIYLYYWTHGSTRAILQMQLLSIGPM